MAVEDHAFHPRPVGRRGEEAVVLIAIVANPEAMKVGPILAQHLPWRGKPLAVGIEMIGLTKKGHVLLKQPPLRLRRLSPGKPRDRHCARNKALCETPHHPALQMHQRSKSTPAAHGRV